MRAIRVTIPRVSSSAGKVPEMLCGGMDMQVPQPPPEPQQFHGEGELPGHRGKVPEDLVGVELRNVARPEPFVGGVRMRMRKSPGLARACQERETGVEPATFSLGS